MKRFGIDEQVVASSTHHYSNGTMTNILKRASEKVGEERPWGVFEWCYKENLVSNGGWLDDDAVARKRATVTVFMWNTEYENQEPNPTGRAIDPDKCSAAFVSSLGDAAGTEHEYYEFEAPDKGGLPELECHRCKHPYEPLETYVTNCHYCRIQRRLTRKGVYAHGADWAKKKDWSIYTTLRIDVNPARVVAWKRTGRLDWPTMVKAFEYQVKRFGGGAAHDATGIGDVIGDYLTIGSEGVIMQGLPRYELLSHYIHAIENSRIQMPMIKFMWDEHRLASVEDVYKGGEKNHLPDSISSAALAWKASGLGSVGEIYVPTLDSLGNIIMQSSHAFNDKDRIQ
jgi:hypothetical protein